MKTWVLVLVLFSEKNGVETTVLDGFETFHLCMNAGGKILQATQNNLKPVPGFMEMDGIEVPGGRFTCLEIEKAKPTEHQGEALSPLR